MQNIKIHVLTVCEACQGKAYLPAGEAISSTGEPYLRYIPCPHCQGSGRQARWISLEELVHLHAPLLVSELLHTSSTRSSTVANTSDRNHSKRRN